MSYLTDGGGRAVARASAGLVVALIAGVLLGGCSAPKAKDGGRTEVVVSLPVVAYFVERIGGGLVEVSAMIPQSASHDTYTPRPSQMAALSGAAAYLALGPLDFETTWQERLTSVSPQMRWVRLDEGIELHEGECCGSCSHEDPHYWMSPRRAAQMCRNISAELKKLLPGSAGRIDSAEAVVEAEVKAYDGRLRELGERNPGRAFMIYHPALGYMAADYGFSQIAIEHEGGAPSARTYMELTKEAKAKGVGVVFVQEGYDPVRAEAAATDLGAAIVSINPEGYDWGKTMEIILEALQ